MFACRAGSSFALFDEHTFRRQAFGLDTAEELPDFFVECIWIHMAKVWSFQIAAIVCSH